MAIADRIEIGDIINLYEFDDRGAWKNCILLAYPDSDIPSWIVKNEEGVVLYIPAVQVVVELRAKSIA